jgi:putative membrane protein
MNQKVIIEEASFSPKIKGFMLLIGFLLLSITIVGIPLAVIWVLGPGQYFGRRYQENLSCTLTHRHLEFKKGIFFKVEKTIPLENIQDLTFVDNPVLQWFDLQILKIETAGHSGANTSDMKLLGIIDLGEFKKSVLNQRDILSEKSMQSSTNTESSNALLTEIRDLLKEIRDQK